MPDTSIAIKLHDNYSEAIRSMRETTTPFRSDVEALGTELDRLNSRKVDLKVDLQRAKNELADARKSFRTACEGTDELDQAMAELNLAMAEADYSNIEEQLSVVSKQAKQTQKDMLEATDAISRVDNRASNRAASGGAGEASMMETLGKAGFLNMAGNIAGQWADAIVGSAFGGEAGGMISGVLSGVASGAAMGSFLGPGGAAIGAAVGGALGLAGGAAQSFQNRDTAFKEYYSGLYDAADQGTAESLASGSDTAAQREIDAIAFNRLLGEGKGDQYLDDLRVMAAATPMEYGDLTGMSRALATGFGDSPERMLALMGAIGDAGSAVGVTTSDMQEMARAMSRMNSSGKATLEFLNIFQDRGVDVIGMLGEAMGKTQGEVYDMISKGDINGQAAADIIQRGMEETYGGAMDVMSETFKGLTSTLDDTMTEIDNAMGEGYNSRRVGGLQAEIDAYGGALGDVMGTINGIVGENKAYLENLGEQYQREALSAVFLGKNTTLYRGDDAAALRGMGEEYRQAATEYEQTGSRDAALKMEQLKNQAEALATAVYEDSDQYKAVVDAQIDSIDAIRENTSGLEAATNAYRLAQARDKGVFAKADGVDTASAVTSGLYRGRGSLTGANSHATGLERVPYDGYLALLHKDETVLTASQAAARRGEREPGGGVSVQIGEINMGGRATEDEARQVVQIIADELALRQQAGAFQKGG